MQKLNIYLELLVGARGRFGLPRQLLHALLYLLRPCSRALTRYLYMAQVSFSTAGLTFSLHVHRFDRFVWNKTGHAKHARRVSHREVASQPRPLRRE